MVVPTPTQPPAHISGESKTRDQIRVGYFRSTAAKVPLIGVLVLACVVRIVPVLNADFPLGDGGLFYLMVKVLQHAHYALPPTVQYNGRNLPFTYPPLGFYVTGWFIDLTGLPLLSAMRLLPLATSILTVGAVGLLARSVLGSRTQVLGTLFAFGAAPLAYRYFIMGAGITRGPGLLFAVLAIWQAYLVCTRGQLRFLGGTTLFVALTILSHPNATWFAAYSVTLVFIFFGRHRAGVRHALLIAGGSLLLTMPWWLLILERYGFAPFLSASQSGSPESPAWLLLLQLRITSEPLYPVLLTGALLGMLCCLRDRRYWLPTWFVISCVLDTRYSGTFATVPLALLVGVGVDGIFGLCRQVLTNGERRRMSPAITVLLGWVGVYVYIAALALPGPALKALPASQRAAMRWVVAHTSPRSRFLIVAPAGDSAGSESEWFPALTNRISLGTYQGTEWLKQRRGPSLWQQYDDLQACGVQDVRCLDSWAHRSHAHFQFIYVRTPGTSPLRDSLLHDAAYRLAFRGPGVRIYARRMET